MLNLSTHQLNVFLAATETLNFTRAARRLQVTQPSVSQQIQALEERLGLPLFVRSGRNVELTEAAQVLIPLARELVYLSVQVEETIASLKGDVHGHLIVGCSTSTGRYILPRLLASFHRQHPQIRTTCQVTTPDQALQLLAEGKVHLVLASNPPPCQDIEFCKFTDEEILLVVPMDHPWAHRSRIGLPELLEADFILPEAGSETYTAIREALAEAGMAMDQLRNLVSLGSLESIAFSIQEGLGIGFLPKLVINRLVQGKVAPVQVSGLNIHREVSIGRNTRRQATAAQKAFWGLIQDQVQLPLQNTGFILQKA
ncbi:MAG TPA: LysR family transcriptional regulator [Anaerolineales bacterium]